MVKKDSLPYLSKIIRVRNYENLPPLHFAAVPVSFWLYDDGSPQR